ncbi:MAG TPA: hypothetical protein VNZ54_05335 [bacterium]|nr:hypothetical protein [bacterium]
MGQISLMKFVLGWRETVASEKRKVEEWQKGVLGLTAVLIPGAFVLVPDLIFGPYWATINSNPSISVIVCFCSAMLIYFIVAGIIFIIPVKRRTDIEKL